MTRIRLRLAVVAGLAIMLSCCLSGCTPGVPMVVPTVSAAQTQSSETSSINGEWIVTRTVTKTDDTNNPSHAVGAVSVRDVLFSALKCSAGSCGGTVASGPTTAVRDTTTFTADGNVFRFEFSGFVNCLRPADGTVLVANGFQYHSTVELTVPDAAGGATNSPVATLAGTLTYSDSITNAALSAGCARQPVSTTTEYTLVAVRAAKN